MKYLRRFLFIFLIFILVLLTGAVVLAAIFEDEMGAEVVKQLDEQLASDLRVENVELSVFSGFPKASVNLNNITLKDRGNKKDLLKAERLSFRFGLLSLFFGDQIKVHSVVIENGGLNMHIDRRGRGNYEIMKESETPVESEEELSFSIALDEATLDNIRLRYRDDRTKQDVKMLINNATFSGQFSEEKFDLASEAKIKSDYINIGDIDYLADRKLEYDAIISVDMRSGKYEFKKVGLVVNDNEFILDGSIVSKSKDTNFDLLLTSDESNLSAVVQLLPAEYADYFSDFSSTGEFDFEVWVQGKMNEKEMPSIESKLSLKKGKISSPKLDATLKDVSFTAAFTNGQYRNNRSSLFEIKDFKGYFARELVGLNFSLNNLDDPQIDFGLNGILPLDAVYGLFDNPMITDGSGKVKFNKLRVEGSYDDMISNADITKVDTRGEMEFDAATLTINGEEVSLEEGKIRLDNNKLTVENLTMQGADSDATFDGTFYNVLPVLFADSLNSKNAELKFTSKLHSKKMDLDKILALLEPPPIKEGKVTREEMDSLQEKVVIQREQFTNYLKGTFDATIDEFNYEKIEGTNFLGKLEYDHNKMFIKGRSDGMGGSFDVDSRVFFTAKPRIDANVITTGVDIKEFFRQLENFGQDILMDENLSGKLNSKMIITAKFDEKGEFDYDALSVYAGIGLNNGLLKDFEMLENFSDYVHVDDLKTIRFKNVQTFLEISRKHIYIPVLFIQSNALNMELSGEYTFSHVFDFNTKINVTQVLANRFKEHDKKLKLKPAKKNGFFNLYYKVFGTFDKYEYKMAKREVKQDFERSEHRRRQIRVKLRQEFGEIKLIDRRQEWDDEDE